MKTTIEMNAEDAERLELFIRWLTYEDVDRVTGLYSTQEALDMLLNVQCALGEALLPVREDRRRRDPLGGVR